MGFFDLELCSLISANALAADIFTVPVCSSSLLMSSTLLIIRPMLSSSGFSSSFFTSSGYSNSSSEAFFSSCCSYSWISSFLSSHGDSNSLSVNVKTIPEKVNLGERDYVGAEGNVGIINSLSFDSISFFSFSSGLMILLLTTDENTKISHRQSGWEVLSSCWEVFFFLLLLFLHCFIGLNFFL